MLVLRNAFTRVRRFDDFQRSLGVPKHILSLRLKKLVEAGVMVRQPYQQAPVRHEYLLTKKGKALYHIVMAMAGWGNAWMSDDDGPLMSYIHAECGKPFKPLLACSECGEEVLPHKVLVSLQPIATPVAPVEAQKST